MGWSIGFDTNWNRDIGYGVPATCDHPGCNERINRGLGHVCGSEPYGGEHGCGLFFCDKHILFNEIENTGDCVSQCERCINEKPAFSPSPDVIDWVHWKLEHHSWAEWRKANLEAVAEMKKQMVEASK